VNDNRHLSRRTVLSGASAAMVVSTTACSIGGSPNAPAESGFQGSHAGEQRSAGEMALCWCPPGSFRMGSPTTEPQRRADELQVGVTLSRGFWIGKFSVTQAQWIGVMGQLPGEVDAGEGGDFPVYNVNHSEAERFCDALTAVTHSAGALPAGWEFRLPTEAQWEYACRAGSATATAFGDQLSSRQANFRGEHPYNGAAPGPTLGRTERVGAYPPNAWGLHDMHGNVFDWCRDWYHGRLPGGTDPDLWSARSTALLNGDGTISRVRRGGCWSDEGWPCRSACRLRYEPERRATHIGFRVVAVSL
jgi:sulfatase modifying factor 1